MIEVQRRERGSMGWLYSLRINDEVYGPHDENRVKVYEYESNVCLELDDPDVTTKLSAYSLNEIPPEITHMIFTSDGLMYIENSLLAPIERIYFERKPGKPFEISCNIGTRTENWDASFSELEFLGQIYGRLRRNYDISFERDSFFSIMRFHPTNLDGPIEAEISVHRETLQAIHDETRIQLTSLTRKETLTVVVNVPEPIRTICEQYLLYFVQFLRDLGVQAETSLTHEAGEVLFSVTPTDRNDALGKIRTALDFYLDLPSSPLNDTANDSVEVQRLELAVLRLRGDLKLAAAELQAKNATIKAQNMMIGMLNGEVLVNSVREIAPKPDDKEDVIPGIVSLSTYKEKGVEINLGEMFRRLKRFFLED